MSRFVALLSVVVVLLAAVSFMSWALIASAHADDMYPIPTVNGIWLALVAETEEGVLYRPQYDGNSFGGTRYMPVPILMACDACDALSQAAHEYAGIGIAWVEVGETDSHESD